MDIQNIAPSTTSIRRHLLENPTSRTFAENNLNASLNGKIFLKRDGYASYIPRTNEPSLGYPVMRYKGGNVGANLFRNSENLNLTGTDGWGKTRGTLTTDTGIAPDGTATAATLECTVEGAVYIYQSVSFTAGEFYTTSFFLKNLTVDDSTNGRTGGTDSPFYIRMQDNNIYFKDDGTHRLGSRYYIVNVNQLDDGWHRVSVTVKATITRAENIQIGYLGAVGEQCLIWGPQFEQSRAMGAYIATGASAIVGPSIPETPIGVDCSREEKEGFLLEASRVNECVVSEGFSDASASWVFFGTGSLTVEANTTEVIAPDGNDTATKFTHDGSSRRLGCNANVLNGNSAVGSAWTTSVYVKRGTANVAVLSWIHFAGGSTSKTLAIEYNFTTGQTLKTFDNGVINSTLEFGTYYVGDGWYRMFISSDIENADNNTLRNDLRTADGGTVYFWGAQVENCVFPTSYTPTEGVRTGRARDFATMPSQGNIYAGEDGHGGFSAFVRFNRISFVRTFEQVLDLPNKFALLGQNNYINQYSTMRRNDATSTYSSIGGFEYRQPSSYVIKYEPINDTQGYHESHQDGVRESRTLQTTDNMLFNYSESGSEMDIIRENSSVVACCHISDLRFYDFALNDAEIKYLSGVK